MPADGVDVAEITVLAPSQIVVLALHTTVGVGVTVIEKVVGVPVQPFNTGVTVILAVTAEAPVFVPVKAGMFPVPAAASPIPGSVLVQLNVAPAGVLVKLMAGTNCVLHRLLFASAVITGTGFTVTVTVAEPIQPLLLAVTV